MTTKAYPMHKDAEIQIILAAQKDPKAFSPLYEKYFPPIFRFIHKRTDDEALTSDLCSQTFLQVLKNISKYKLQGLPFSAWLYRIAINEVNRYFRDNKKRRSVNITSEGIAEIFEEFKKTDQEEKIKLLQSCLGELDSEKIQLIELRFFEQRPFKEIAQILQITENNAKVKTYRILDVLRKKMQAKNSTS